MSKNESYKFQRLYRNLYNPEFYWLAYKNIYANTGSMTAGADGNICTGFFVVGCCDVGRGDPTPPGEFATAAKQQGGVKTPPYE